MKTLLPCESSRENFSVVSLAQLLAQVQSRKVIANRKTGPFVSKFNVLNINPKKCGIFE